MTKFQRNPIWQIEGGSRQLELCKSKILLRCWSHTWQKKTTEKKQNSDTLNPQPTQSFSTPRYPEEPGGILMPCYPEEPGGILHHQAQAPNLLGNTVQQMSKQVACSILTATPGINQHSPLDRSTLHPPKKLNKK
jgi:hypothetical protein